MGPVEMAQVGSLSFHSLQSYEFSRVEVLVVICRLWYLTLFGDFAFLGGGRLLFIVALFEYNDNKNETGIRRKPHIGP